MIGEFRPKAWISYLPAILISLVAIGVAGALGGPIAAAIAAFVAVPSLLGACILTILVRLKYKPGSTIVALGLGLGLYLSAAFVVFVYLYFYGPTQIM